MNDTKLRFEHFACLTASSETIEQHEKTATDYQSHEPLYETDKGYALYELHSDDEN